MRAALAALVLLGAPAQISGAVPALIIGTVPALILGAVPARARPVVVEMFTSQACSDCPPADALLGKLAAQPGILALSFDVAYWNSAAWNDAYALPGAATRQNWYAALHHSQEVYTPEAVVDGTSQLVGSDRAKMTAAIAAARAAPAGDTAMTIGGGQTVKIGIGPGAAGARIWLFGYDPAHTTHIGGGENGGITLTQVNIVRSMTDLGTWNGRQTALTVARPAGRHLAVLLQNADGAVVGAAAE
jgi:hypothetical protein